MLIECKETTKLRNMTDHELVSYCESEYNSVVTNFLIEKIKTNLNDYDLLEEIDELQNQIKKLNNKLSQ